MSCATKNNGGCQEGPETPNNGKNKPKGPTIQVDVPTPELVDRRVSLLVAAGSAMAAGCEPCMDQIIPNLINAGAADGDIRRAVEIGQRVKEAAADYMKEVADVLAGTHFAQSAGPAAVPNDLTPEKVPAVGIPCCK